MVVWKEATQEGGSGPVSGEKASNQGSVVVWHLLPQARTVLGNRWGNAL